MSEFVNHLTHLNLISGLKMSTNYTFYLSGDLVDRHSRHLSAIEKSIFLVTKGFRDDQSQCQCHGPKIINYFPISFNLMILNNNALQ